MARSPLSSGSWGLPAVEGVAAGPVSPGWRCSEGPRSAGWDAAGQGAVSLEAAVELGAAVEVIGRWSYPARVAAGLGGEAVSRAL